MGRSSPASATSAGSSWARTPLSSGSAGFRLPAEVPQQRSADHCSISWLSLTRRRAVAHPRPRAGRGAASEPLPTAAVGHPRPHRGGAADAADGELLVAVLEDAVEQLGADRHDPACGPHWTSTCCQRRRVRPSPPARSRPAARPAEPPPSRAARWTSWARDSTRTRPLSAGDVTCASSADPLEAVLRAALRAAASHTTSASCSARSNASRGNRCSTGTTRSSATRTSRPRRSCATSGSKRLRPCSKVTPKARSTTWTARSCG